MAEERSERYEMIFKLNYFSISFTPPPAFIFLPSERSKQSMIDAKFGRILTSDLSSPQMLIIRVERNRLIGVGWDLS